MLLTLSSRFQSALPRGERLVSVQIVILQLKISIRAPARGATLPPFPHSRPYVISIRAPARGATYAYRMYQTDTEISIRAPARGATLYAYRLGRIILFQSALPRGERHSTQPNLDWTLAFQSALPRGERRYGAAVDALDYLFQSALPRGERLCFIGYHFLIHTFQSALPRGERRFGEKSFPPFLLISIRAPARGATLLPGQYNQQYCISIRAPARGATVS